MARIYQVVLPLLVLFVIHDKLISASRNSRDLEDGQYRLVCYHTNWAQYRKGSAKFTVENIDRHLCTHIIYSFAKIQNGVLTPYEWNDDPEWGVGNYKKFTDLKNRNPDLKLLLAVGGWTHGSGPFTEVVNSLTLRQQFIQHAIGFLRNRNFDGLDLDWEFPAARGSPANDKKMFTKFCQELRAEFEAEAVATKRPRLLLTSAVAAGYTYIDNGYEIAAISQALDFLNLMAYDLHGGWEPFIGHHTTLYASEQDDEDNKKLTVEYAVNKWLDGGCPPRKLNVGMGLYGRGFTLAGANVNIGASASGPSAPGPYLNEDGYLAYYEICQKLASGYTTAYDEERKSRYAYGDGQWIGYDDPNSLQEKVNFIQSRGLGGGMIWAMDLDDFNGGFCNQGSWPLLRAIRKALDNAGNQAPPPTTTAKSAPTARAKLSTILTSTSKPTTKESGAGQSGGAFSCNGLDGLFADPTSCSSFYQCHGGAGQYIVKKYCASGLVFNPNYKYCDWPYNYKCDLSKSSPTTTAKPTTTTAKPTTTTAKPTTTKSANDPVPFSCDGQDGLFSDPNSCSYYYQCYGGSGQYKIRQACSSGLVFNPNRKYCDWPNNYACVNP